MIAKPPVRCVLYVSILKRNESVLIDTSFHFNVKFKNKMLSLTDTREQLFQRRFNHRFVIMAQRQKIDIWKGTESRVRYEQVERKMRIAAHIEDAMNQAGLTKTQFARLMGKYPSEITKWLSGTHNFTSDLLTEIEVTLGAPHYAEDIVSGYCDTGSANTALLCEPESDVHRIILPLSSEQYATLIEKAQKAGKTPSQYLTELI